MDWEVPSFIPRQPGRRRLWLTADEHYGHRRIIGYQQRPFETVDAMDASLIARHNASVGPSDTVIHIGDFSFGRAPDFLRVASQLNGTHCFMDGSHDRSMREFFSTPELTSAHPKFHLLPKIFEFTFSSVKVVLCHYALHNWWASHYQGSSVHFHGHSHGRFQSPFHALDVGVDTNDFRPYQIEEAIRQAQEKPPIPRV